MDSFQIWTLNLYKNSISTQLAQRLTLILLNIQSFYLCFGIMPCFLVDY